MKKPAFGNTPAGISVRNKIELAHHEWMSALDVVDALIFLHDKEFRILRCNKAYQQHAGIPYHELIGQPYYEVFPKNHEPLPCCLQAVENLEEEKEEVTVGGAIYRSRAFSIHDEQGAYLYSVHTMEDITESKRAEQVLKKSVAMLKEAQHFAGMGNWMWNTETDTHTWSEEIYLIYGRDLGLPPADFQEVGKYFTPESWESLSAAVEEGLAQAKPYECDAEVVRPDGTRRWIVARGAATCDASGKVINLYGTVLDITERKQAEAAIEHANRALAALGAVNHTLVHATDENTLLLAVCNAIVEQKGYRMAWVGYVQHDAAKSIKIMARAGHDEGYLESMQITWAETEMGLSGRAIHSGATQLCQDIAHDPLFLPWREAALQRGYAASIALPLLNADNTVFGTMAVYSNEVNAFSPAEVNLLEEMASDLAFGVRSLHIRHERDLALFKNQEQLVQLVFQNEEKEKRAAELVIANKELVFQNEEKEKRAAELVIANKKLQDSLEDTVRAIATIGEMRDPYTSGHQVRVADLATAIAKQLGLPDEQVHAIHLAGMVHDLGKIKVPAEILSKPGRITDIEFSLIKIHPQAGYDILKGIDFPWPIAQIVLQHHERLDGSGYPQGLKGEQIIIEARILSVADVVEAMSSHRPYRPGLGIEVALAEITRQRGIHFDPAVVDACLALFREQHYSFKS
ncbi:MAG: HD domain-containing protein [Sideroxyarcus sp.]|nr:HD domain-containing protein [Sideroxyarcus sp.]